MLDALRHLKPADLAEARRLLMRASGRRIMWIPDLYDVELVPVLEKLRGMLRDQRAGQRPAQRTA